MTNRAKKILAIGLSLGLICSGCSAGGATEDGKTETGETTQTATESGDVLPVDQIKVGNTSYELSCHDPQIIAADGTYYMTGSHQVIAKSDDLSSWEYVRNGNKMFDNIFSGDLDAFKYVGKNEQGGYSIWASNIYYNETMKKYLMYFCTSSTYIKSTLTLGISDTPEGPYTFTDVLLYSGFGKKDIASTDLGEVLGKKGDTEKYLAYGGYDNKRWPNCIDPAIFTDEMGTMWMVYGSWSGGIFLLKIDPSTGLPIHPEEDEAASVDRYFGYHLLGGGHHAMEGPYIHYDKESGYYYLFLSFGELKRDGGYQVRVFRSEAPTGPYVDAQGKTPADEEDFYNYGVKMMGNYKFPSLETAYMAPGGQSTFTGDDGKLYMTFHTRFDSGSEYHEPRVHRLYRTETGWYVAAPFETTGENTAEDQTYKAADVSGTYHMLNFGFDISSKIRESEPCELSDGTITGTMDDKECTGTYEVQEGTNKIKLVVGDVEYSGVIADMPDEAGNNTRCIMAVGSNNQTIWGVQYRR